MYQVYQVMPGESLEQIASRYQTTLQNLALINGLQQPINLVPGTYLVVPKMGNDLFNRYIVKKGDSLYSIAERFNTTAQLLELLNGLEKNEYIYPNQELLIPSEDIVVYVTKNETLQDISEQLGIEVNALASENPQLYVVSDQVVVHKNQ